MGGFFTYKFDATRKPEIYEQNDNEPGQPFHMDANVTAGGGGGAGPTLDTSIPRDQGIENNDYWPANVPSEFLILRDEPNRHGILHGKEQEEREIISRDEKEIELRKLDQIAEELGKFL